MKSILKILVLFLFFFLTTVQFSTAQTKAGITAGANFSNAYIEDHNGEIKETQAIPGIRIGLTADIPVIGVVYIQPGLVYSRKGFKQKSNWFSGIDNEFEVAVSYIEVPVNLLYKPQIGSGNLVIGAGAYAGYGLGGKWNTQTDVAIGDIIIKNSGDAIFENDIKDGEFGNYLYGKPLD